MTNPREILATIDRLVTEAQRHSPGGALLTHDLDGLYRRAGHIHHVTPDQVRALHAAGTTRRRPRHPATNIGE